MKISLRIKGETKNYTVGYINMMTVRKAMEIQEQIEDLANPTPAQLDMVVDFIVDAYDNQFTREEFYRGMKAKGFVNTAVNIINDIVEMLLKSVDDMGE
jgi:hypothetical protein